MRRGTGQCRMHEVFVQPLCTSSAISCWGIPFINFISAVEFFFMWFLDKICCVSCPYLFCVRLVSKMHTLWKGRSHVCLNHRPGNACFTYN
mmetsp:Transcript_15718/g.27680  ORF Transcript_15718/g.27680 Transcript_15718/m.27680 type:complete len:91 (-) Transcript_15718:613-885(-)